MAVAGNIPLEKKQALTSPDKLHCMYCNNEYRIKEFYNSDSELHRSIGKIPYCRSCLVKIYNKYLEKYRGLEYPNPDRRAVEKMCMTFDMYYSDEIFDIAIKNMEKDGKIDAPVVLSYFRFSKLKQYRDTDYDTTIHERYEIEKDKELKLSEPRIIEGDEHRVETIETAIKIFGGGFDDDDYIYLMEQYNDWTARNECNTKAQETVFKNICLTELQLLKATRTKQDTKDLSVQLQKWLDTGKLQPKQNSGDTVSDTQTFGTLIDKWENTRPIPEVEESLKDVDGIKKYIDIFFKGGLAKSLGLNIEYTDEYDEYMENYTARKPEYDEDEKSNSFLHEAIFGRDLDDDVGDL